VRGTAGDSNPVKDPTGSIATSVGSPDWSRALAAQVQMLASAKVQTATLRLSPEHLGPLEVRIDLQSAQINVNFIAAHPETRSALEQSVPTLRALLAHGGLTLGQAQVQGESRSGSHSAAAHSRSNRLDAPEESPVGIRTTRGIGLVDEYA